MPAEQTPQEREERRARLRARMAVPVAPEAREARPRAQAGKTREELGRKRLRKFLWSRFG